MESNCESIESTMLFSVFQLIHHTTGYEIFDPQIYQQIYGRIIICLNESISSFKTRLFGQLLWSTVIICISVALLPLKLNTCYNRLLHSIQSCPVSIIYYVWKQPADIELSKGIKY